MRLLCMVAAVSITALSAAPAQSVDAWSFTMRTTTDSGRGRAIVSRTMTEQVADRLMRFELVRSPNPSSSPSADSEYMVFSAGDGSVAVVRPASHRATISSRGSAGDPLHVPQLRYHPGATKQLRDLGPGEAILGHATEHYRATIKATVDLTVFGSTCTRSMNGTTDYWIAPDVDLRAPLQEQAALLGLGDAGFGSIVTNAPRVKLPTGTPLRTVARMTRLNAQGSLDTISTTSELLELRHGPVSVSRFAIPVGYTITDVRPTMARTRGRLDSAMKAGAAKAFAKSCDGTK